MTAKLFRSSSPDKKSLHSTSSWLSEGDVALHLKPTGDANPFEELFSPVSRVLAHPSGADRLTGRLAPRRTTVPDQIESWEAIPSLSVSAGARPTQTVGRWEDL